MTDHDRASVTANGDSAQTYFSRAFWLDSSNPLAVDDELIVWPTADGGLHLVPVRNLSIDDYPLAIDAPPPDARPRETADLSPDGSVATDD